MIAVFYAIEDEIGGSLKGFSLEKEICLPRWRKIEHESLVRVGKYQDNPLILVQTGFRSIGGIGNVQSKEMTEFVLKNFDVKTIIIAATGGALKKDLQREDIVICNPICAEGKPSLLPSKDLYSLAVKTLREKGKRYYVGGSLTIPCFIENLEDKKQMAKNHPQVLLVEMENYFIASVAQERKVSFLAVRVIGDTLQSYNSHDEAIEECSQVGTILRDNFLLPLLQRLKGGI